MYPILSRVLGLLLLAAAGLKVYGLAAEPVGAAGPFSAPGFQVGVVQLEIFLGVWLLWGKHPVGAWVVALLVFTGFAAVSGYLGWAGQPSCGCFGKLSVSPWYAFGIDLAALVALLVARPDLALLREKGRPSLARVLATAAFGLLSVIAVFGMLAGLAALRFGSPEAALAYFRGELVSVRPRLVEVGEGVPGEHLQATVELVNRTDRPIRVVGGTSDCSCVATENLPLTLAPGEARSVTVHVRLSGAPGMFTRQVAFLTADDRLREIRFRLTGWVRETEAGSRSAKGD